MNRIPKPYFDINRKKAKVDFSSFEFNNCRDDGSNHRSLKL